MIFCFIMIFASCPWLQGKWSCCSDCSETPFCFALEENGSHCPHWGGIFCLRQGLLGFSFQVDTLVTIGHGFWRLYFTIEKGNCTILLVRAILFTCNHIGRILFHTGSVVLYFVACNEKSKSRPSLILCGVKSSEANIRLCIWNQKWEPISVSRILVAYN